VVIALPIYFFFIRQIKMAAKGASVSARGKPGSWPRNANRHIQGSSLAIDEAIVGSFRLVEFPKDPKKISTPGAADSKGVLMVGPPGSRQNALAQASP